MNQDKIRTFIAVDLNEDVRNKLMNFIKTQEGKINGIKWIKKENLHLTIKFLGNVSEKNLKHINGNLSNINNDIKKFKMKIKGLGLFHHVIWVGITDGREELIKLAKVVDEKLAVEDLRKKFHPHITIGRIKSSFCKLLEIKKDIEFGISYVREILIMKSVLNPKGAEYSVMYRHLLG